MPAPFDVGAAVALADAAVEAVPMEIRALDVGAVLVTVSATMPLRGATGSPRELPLYRKDGRDYHSADVGRRQRQTRTRTLP